MRSPLHDDSSDDEDTPDTVREEHCPSCERRTPQRVTIEIRQEGSDHATRRETMKYARGPYRITECLRCETLTAERIDSR